MSKCWKYISVLIFLPLLIQAGELDRRMASAGLVNVLKEDPSIRVDLKYATNDNFLGEAVYEGITGIWLHPDAAKKLLKAQELLKKRISFLCIIGI